DRLPDATRLPLVLCYLDGLSRDEAAQQLGRSLNSVKKALERGRDVLRKRLTRRGVTLSAGVLWGRGGAAGGGAGHGTQGGRRGGKGVHRGGGGPGWGGGGVGGWGWRRGRGQSPAPSPPGGPLCSGVSVSPPYWHVSHWQRVQIRSSRSGNQLHNPSRWRS